MSLQTAALTSFTFRYLEQNFLKQFKKQTQARSKPSKAVLEALKHSTSLNKSYKTENQSLKTELFSIIQENDFLKSMIDNLKGELKFLKESKKEKLKKLCENQTNLMMKVEFLTNENTLLKTQIKMLKSKAQSDSQTSKPDQIQTQITAVFQNPLSNQLGNSEPTSQFSICLQQSSKLRQYLNYESQKKENSETQPNSKLKIQLQEIGNFKNTNKSGFGRSECEELTNMLNLRHDSHDLLGDEDPLALGSGHLSSLDDLSPKITQITSQQEILIEEQSNKLQTPTLRKISSDKINQSKLKVISEDNKEHLSDKKGPQFTFLQLQTRKSIEDGNHKASHKSLICEENVKTSLDKNNLFQKDQLKALNQQIYLQNISGVDYEGLMEDIHNGDTQLENKPQVQGNETDDFFYQPPTRKRSGSVADSENTAFKGLSSDLYFPENIEERGIETSEITNQIEEQERIRNLAFNQSTLKNSNQNMKIAVHEPLKYLTVAQSFKTIEMGKSSKNIQSSEQEQKKSINKNEFEGIRNSSSYMSRSRHSPRSMMNSKMMIMNNVRNNMRHRTLSPLSIENDVEGKDEPISPTTLYVDGCYLDSQQSSKSFSMIQSLRNKMNASKMKKNMSMINDQQNLCEQTSEISNYSSFRKRIHEEKRTSIHPMVTFKTGNDVDQNEEDQRVCEGVDLINEDK